VTATLVEVAAADPPVIMGVLVPGQVEERIRRQARTAQVDLGAIISSWLAVSDPDAPMPEGSSAAVRAAVPAPLAAELREEARRRGLQVAQVAAARLASIASRGG
jgi:hypothetical protein